MGDMITSDAIIDAHIKEDDEHVDLEAVVNEMREALEEVQHPLGQGDLLAVELAHLAWSVGYVAELMLRIGAEAGVLPEGYDQEAHNFAAALSFDKMRRLYDRVYVARLPKLEVPGQTRLEVVT